MPWFRQRSFVATPASCSLRMATICVSVNRDFSLVVSFEAGGLRILHPFSEPFSGYTSNVIQSHDVARCD